MDPNFTADSSCKTNSPVEKTVTSRELWKAMLPEVVANVTEIVNEGL